MRDLFERARLNERKLWIEIVKNFSSCTDRGKRVAAGAHDIAEVGVAAALVEFEYDGSRRLVEIDQSGIRDDSDDPAIRVFWIICITDALVERAVAGEI